jgi:hypothetical protein
LTLSFTVVVRDLDLDPVADLKHPLVGEVAIGRKDDHRRVFQRLGIGNAVRAVSTAAA